MQSNWLKKESKERRNRYRPSSLQPENTDEIEKENTSVTVEIQSINKIYNVPGSVVSLFAHNVAAINP